MDEELKRVKAKKVRKPLGKVGQTALNLLITALVGLVYFYFALPPINLHAEEFYAFLLLLCAVYVVCALFLSGQGAAQRKDVKVFFRFARSQCAPVLVFFGGVLLVAVIGWLASVPLFRAGAYRELLTVGEGDFTTQVSEVSYNEIPMLDEDSAEMLGDRKMGELSDLVSQFEVSDAYTQINYQGRPVRVTYLEYGDFFKWLGNRKNGLPAYITVDMVTQAADVVRLEEGMRYSPSELFNRKLERHLRFQYPTFMFSQPTFEVNEEGYPYWVCPKLEKTIGLFGGVDIHGAVLVDAVTGESAYYEEVPPWVDRVYLANLIMDQYNYHGLYVNGFWNSIFGQKDVTVTTEGYNYIAMNDDVYMYTGVTSVTGDQSNVGFLLSNQRTKETTYYKAPGAVERSAMNSAQGVVQDLGYQATWPLLLNISGEPTYFMSLKDANQLVKLYAMVNVAQYQVVATGSTVAQCEANYLKLLSQQGITQTPEIPTTRTSGTIIDLRTAVIDGNSVYYLRLDGQAAYYTISAADQPDVVTLNVGDRVAVSFAPSAQEGAALLPALRVERLGA